MEPSFLDILYPHRADEVQASSALLRSICHDLEILLNTRRPDKLPDGNLFWAEVYPRLVTSCFYYGIRDQAGVDVPSQSEWYKFGDHISEVIAIFEPRLVNAKATPRTFPGLVPPRDQRMAPDLSVHFDIRASLATKDGSKPPADFVSNFSRATGHHKVEIPKEPARTEQARDTARESGTTG